MKILQATLVLLLVATIGFAQSEINAIDKYFKQYVDDDRFTVVYISPKLFKMIGKLDVDGLDIEDEEAEAFIDIAKDLEGLRILAAEENGLAFYKEAKEKINTSEYEVLMTVRDNDGSNVDFLVLDSNDGNIINELLLLVGGEDDEFVLLSFTGKIDLNKVSKLANSIENDDDDDDDDN